MFEFFTSDLHFGHSNIIGYSNRPYSDAEEMNAKLIANINSRCKAEDVLYHVGDFACYGKAIGVEGSRVNPREYEALINPKIIHINGNHDLNNKVKASILGAMIKLQNYNCWVSHIPPWDQKATLAPSNVDVYICGHVHEKWKYNTHDRKPVINVGCDVWGYKPIRKDELIGIIEQRIKVEANG